jgi:apolipoprotein N-acyltransferase
VGFSIIVILNALQFAVFAGILSYLFDKNNKLALISFPFLWTFLEYIRQFGDLAYNWLNIAHTQSYYLYLIQYVEFTGLSGVVLWICFINISLYFIWRYRRNMIRMLKWGLVLFLLFLLPLVYGFSQLTGYSSAEGISVSYVQPNVQPQLKWSEAFQRKNLQILLTSTDSLLITDPDLIIWPETSIPYFLGSKKNDYNILIRHVAEKKYHLLAGTIDLSSINHHRFKHNAAYFFSPGDSLVSIYRKLLLVPVAEAFPYERYLPEWMIGSVGESLTPGDKPVTFSLNTNPYRVHYNGEDWQVLGKMEKKKSYIISTVICYESVFPNIVQQFFQRGSEMLIIISNDAWFGNTSQPYQHLQAAVFRAIEQRTSVVRCANTGISSFIDPYGRHFYDSKISERALAQKIMPMRKKNTFYSQYGDLIGIISGILLFSFLILTARFPK